MNNRDVLTEALRLAAEEHANPTPPPPEASQAECLTDFQHALTAAMQRGNHPAVQDPDMPHDAA